MTILYREQFDGMVCPHCGDPVSSDCPAHLCPECHPKAALLVSYGDGLLNLSCAKCKKPVVRIAVASQFASDTRTFAE